MSRSTMDRLICDLFKAILTTGRQEIPELKESDFFIDIITCDQASLIAGYDVNVGAGKERLIQLLDYSSAAP